MKVKDILKTKGPHVFTIGENNSIREAVRILANNNIGSLLVLDEGAKIMGIITERDIIRIMNRNDQFLSTSVKDTMTKDVIVVEPEDEMEYVYRIMTENRLRHLPVVTHKVLVGLISIGDTIKHQLDEFQVENKYLRDYISGNLPKQ